MGSAECNQDDAEPVTHASDIDDERCPEDKVTQAFVFPETYGFGQSNLRKTLDRVARAG
jgi:hypothetical protein